jgi:hypothetical protein
MSHRYDITVAETSNSSVPDAGPINFAFESHDDLAAIVERVSAKQLFDAEETKAFCIGLKLLGGVMLKHRKHDLFQHFAPAFGAFMKTLKARA